MFIVGAMIGFVIGTQVQDAANDLINRGEKK